MIIWGTWESGRVFLPEKREAERILLKWWKAAGEGISWYGAVWFSAASFEVKYRENEKSKHS